MSAGGLPRTDYPGFEAEFSGLVQAAQHDEGTA